MKNYLLVILVLFLQMVTQRVVSQTTLPIVIPPSPETAQFFKFLDYPVGLGTGIPEIDIPIYEVKSGDLTVPINISYHAGGRRVFDETGAVGLGWVLNAGGMISRTIFGKPDDKVQFLTSKTAATLNNKADYEFLRAATAGLNPNSTNPSPLHYDTEYDVFSYSFGPNSGKFIVKQNNAVLMPVKPLSFNASSFPSSAVDDKGIQYFFNEVEYYHSPDYFFGNLISTRLLTSMISPDGRDTIKFIYTSFNKTDFNYTDHLTVLDNDNSTATEGTYKRTYGHNEYEDYSIKRLTQITFKEGKIKFILHPTGNKDQVQAIQILNNQNEIIRTINFLSSLSDYPSFRGSEGVYKLDSLLFLDKSNRLAEKYSFDYMPSGNFRTHDRDYWGYVNSLFGINTLVYPSYNNIVALIGLNGNANTTTFNINGANRIPNNPQAGILKKINYPTGGSTEFSYEPNLYAYGANINLRGPGLRIKQVKTNDGNGEVHYKTYKYGVSECGYGTLPFGSIQMQDMSYEKRYFTGITKQPSTTTARGYRERIYTSEPLPYIAEAFNEPIYYYEIAEYDGTIENNNGKIVYNYSQLPGAGSMQYYLSALPFAPNSPPDYGNYNFSYIRDANLNIRHIKQYDLWKKNLLTSIKVFKKLSGNNYELARQTLNVYKTTRVDTVKGIHIYKYLETSDDEIAAKSLGLALYNFDEYTMISGKQELASSSVYDYVSGGIDSNTVFYTYNENHLLKQRVSLDSKGNIFKTLYKYPFDFGASQVLNYIVEENTFKGNVPLQSTYITLQGTKPITISTKSGNNAYESRIQYRYSNSKNLISVWKEGGSAICLVLE